MGEECVDLFFLNSWKAGISQKRGERQYRGKFSINSRLLFTFSRSADGVREELHMKYTWGKRFFFFWVRHELRASLRARKCPVACDIEAALYVWENGEKSPAHSTWEGKMSFNTMNNLGVWWHWSNTSAFGILLSLNAWWGDITINMTSTSPFILILDTSSY